jgi:ATP-dependent DNA helicase RecG
VLVAVRGGLHEQLLAVLPFQLTAAQRAWCDEIAADLARPQPMHRLLQGDVGSGKTVVAALAAAVAIDAGWQCALMAPTEILAEQHFRKLVQLAGAAGRAPWPGSPAAARARRARDGGAGGQRARRAGGGHARGDPDDVHFRAPGPGGGRRAAPLRRGAAPGAAQDKLATKRRWSRTC